MTEAFVSTILGQLTAITIDKASEAWTLVRGVEKEVKRLEHNFKALQLELEDAEEKQYLDKRLKHWLDRFKQVCYDMEDVLDDWTAALQELQTADNGAETSTTSVRKRKVRPFDWIFSFRSQVFERHEIATRIEAINEDLDRIIKDKDKFDLIKREIIKQPKRQSTSFVDESKLHGRDWVKEDIIKTLLCGTSEEEEVSCIPTISIVGMGGIGKTALAQLIYNDHRVQTHFHKTIWVCASDPFDRNQIARAILEGLDPGSTISLQNKIPLQHLLSKIHENIKEKKFFLVLDDVWIDRGQGWEQLKAAFQSHMSGSRILVTARKESVARHMESSHVIDLDLLSDEICWRILSQKVFTGRNKISRGNLEDVGREIAKKCKGLPLVAKILGGLLQKKLRREEWQIVLNSEMWKIDFAQEYFATLLLSYLDLPSAIRQCLLYCANFPKDELIYKDELVQHWMAQGYLDSDDTQGYLVSDDNSGTKSKGEDYFNCLAACLFFQNFEKDNDGDIIRCKMHDLVHDFVQFLTEYEFVMEEKYGDFTLDLSSKKARHLRLVSRYRGVCSSINGAEKLRSLVAVNYGDEGITTTAALQNLFSQSKHLRILEFHWLDTDAKGFPRDIGKLIHLRYLSLITYPGKNLAEALCELPNLQSLNLKDCLELVKLPDGIGKLINLRYLCIKSCDRLEKLSDGIGKLINLSYLHIECCPCLSELPIGIGKLIKLRYLNTGRYNGLFYYPKEISNLTSLMRLSKIRMRADGNDANELSIGDLENLDLVSGILCVELVGMH